MPVTLKTNSFKYRDDSSEEWSPALVQAIAPLEPAMDRIDEVEGSLALRRTGITNTEASIEAGTYFYLDNILKQAIVAIAQGDEFTAQNCETVTAGGLNSLNNSISTIVKKTTVVATTDRDGDYSVLAMPTGRVFISAVPNRNYGDGTYSNWFGVIIGSGVNNPISVKCINDSMQKLASTKVAIDLYYIDGQQLS